jgi:hypothetical protein
LDVRYILEEKLTGPTDWAGTSKSHPRTAILGKLPGSPASDAKVERVVKSVVPQLPLLRSPWVHLSPEAENEMQIHRRK